MKTFDLFHYWRVKPRDLFHYWGVKPWIFAGLCLTIPCVTLAFQQQPENAAVQPVVQLPIPFELQKYEVRIQVSFGNDPRFSQQFQDQFLADLSNEVNRNWGSCWNFTVQVDSTFQPANANKLDRIQGEEIPPINQPDGNSLDKFYWLTVSSSDEEWEVACREWDGALKSWGATHRRAVDRMNGLPGESGSVITEAFRPLATLDSLIAKSALIRIRAGSLIPSNPELTAWKKKHHWVPFYRLTDKKKKTTRIQSIPWTYFESNPIETEPDLATIEASLLSGVRTPIATKRRLNTEVLCLAVDPAYRPTTLLLRSRGPAKQRLLGYIVEQRDDPKQEDFVSMISDRRGMVTLPPREDRGVNWLTVKSGRNTLAKVPMLPGLFKEEILELPDDTVRVTVESELSILQAELMDTVARRTVIKARAIQEAKKGELETTRKIFAEGKLLPGISKFQTDLTTIRVPAEKAAAEMRDPSSAARIKRLCSETSDIIVKYLEEDKWKAFEEETVAIAEANSKTKPITNEVKAP